MYTLHNFAHIFYEINRFPIQNPYFYVCDFNGKAPLKICYLKKVYYLYTPCERSLRSLAHGCSQNRFVLRLNVNDKFKQYCTKSRGLVCIYRTTSHIFFTKSTVFRVQPSHFYVYSVSGCPSCVHDFNGKAPLKRTIRKPCTFSSSPS